MAKKNILKRILPLGVLIAATAAVGMTGATVLHKLSLENPIKTPPVEGRINEDKMTGHVKDTRFENTGDADVFLRIAYAETWTYDGGEAAVTLPLKAQAKAGDDVRVAKPQWNLEEKDNWLEKDGWLYYKYVLKAGEYKDLDEARKLGILTEPIVTSVEFSDAAELATLVEADLYKDAKYDLHFVMEVVQASDDAEVSKDAIEEVWGSGIVPDSMPGEQDDDTWNKSGAITWNGASAWVQDPTPNEKN